MDKKIRQQEKYYDSINPKYLKADKNRPYARYIVGQILPFVKKSDRILEIGAGQGRFTFELSRWCSHVSATDISSAEIDLINKQLPKITNISASVLDVSKSTLGKQTYDVLCGFFILHHVPDHAESIAGKFSKHLSWGGRMVFIENNPTSPWHLLAILLRKDMTWEIEKGTYTNYIGRFVASCERQGMKIVVRRKFGFFPPEIINGNPAVTRVHKIIESIPVVKDIFCPFILVVAEKT